MKIMLVSTQDYIHHLVPSRHHYIFEELSKRHEIHVPHFHVTAGQERTTNLIVHEATKYPLGSPFIHYIINAPTHFQVLDNIVREHGIDVVVASHVLAGAAAIRAAHRNEIPVLFDLKDWFPDSAAAYYKGALAEIIKRGVLAITKYNLDRSDQITTVSPSLSKKLAGYGYKADVITNGVDTDIFVQMDGQDMRTKIGIGEDDYVLGFEGSVERWYALDHIIHSLPKILEYNPNTKLLIVGGSLFTGYTNELKTITRDLGIQDKVIFTGAAKYNELPQYISAMDLCLMPLAPPQWIDIALPNKFFEYSACGKPILSSPIPDVMAIGGSHLFFYRSDDEFVERVEEIMDVKEQYDLDFSRFSWKNKAMEIEEHLRNIYIG